MIVTNIGFEETRKKILLRIERLELRRTILPKGERWMAHDHELRSKLNTEKRNLDALDLKAKEMRGTE